MFTMKDNLHGARRLRSALGVTSYRAPYCFGITLC
jgi:hypothetical protein